MITGLFGLPGSGKSLFLGFISKRAVEGKNINYKSLNIGTHKNYDKVYTNFPLDGAYNLDFETLGVAYYHDCLIVIDEIMMLADSRNFKNFGEHLKFFFSMHRHFNIDVIYASQCYDDVDKKIRGVTDRLYYIDSIACNLMRVRQIVSYFDVSGGKISEGYEYAPRFYNMYFYKPALYGTIDSKAIINSTIRKEVENIPW